MTKAASDDASVSFLSELPTKERETLEFELKAFGVSHASHHRPIAIVTSGGTAADLELNSVRCLDNFSTGQRGAISVEEFLKRGYAVIHLWRIGSASPYGRLLSQLLGSNPNNAISCASLGRLFVGDSEDDNEEQLVQSVLEARHNDPWLTDPNNMTTNGSSSTQPNSKRTRKSSNEISLHRRIVNSSSLQASLKERNSALKEGRLLTVPFRSVEEYIAKLQLCAESVRHSQSLAILYLAAAVSDFYIPRAERSEHKIQSAGGDGLTLKLSPVPKVLGRLRSAWAPDSFVCSFKLETDKEILRIKAERAVQKYGCHMVIGNLLHTRHDQVCVLAPEHQDSAPSNVKEWQMQEINKPKSSDPQVLESMIVDFVVQAHFEYISSSCSGSFDKAGTEAVLRAHEKLEEERQEVRRELFWKQAQKVVLEWAGVAAGAVLSFAISSALRRKLNG
jgi:phosphopantothenate-cysteine ligase